MSKKIIYISIVFQIAALVLLLMGIELNRNGQNGVTFLYAGFTVQIIVLALVVYLGISKQQIKLNLIDKGNTAEIYEIDQNKVLKLFYKGYPKRVVEEEYKKAKVFNGLIAQSAAAYAVIKKHNRYGIIYERIHGESLLSHILRTGDVEYCATVLSSLHKEILSKKSHDLDHYKTFLYQYINKDDDNSLEQLSNLETGDSLCHGDFHPGNIIINEQQEIIIDYMNCCIGPKQYDIARTYYLIGFSEVPGVIKNIDMINRLKLQLADSYLEKMNVTFSEIEPYFKMIEKTRANEMA